MSFNNRVISKIEAEFGLDWHDYRFVEFFSGGELFALNDLGDSLGPKPWSVISSFDGELKTGNDFRFETFDYFDQWLLAVAEDRTIVVQIYPYAGVGLLLSTKQRSPLVKRSKRALDNFLSSIKSELTGCRDRKLRELLIQVKEYALDLAATKREL